MLAGKTVWITRPQGQADSLIEALEHAGANVRQLPMLAITPLEVDQTIKATVLDLDRFDLLFFISTNAAGLGMSLIHDYWPQFPAGLAVYAVGPTTADEIGRFGIQAEYPPERMSSEALLALDSLRDVDGKKALIVRGVGGRELLAGALRERGVDVEYLELYRRTCPDYDAGELAGLVASENPDAIIVTSAEALDNLSVLLRADGLDAGTLSLFVSSGRIAGIGRDKGFLNLVIMSGADDKAIISSLEEVL